VAEIDDFSVGTRTAVRATLAEPLNREVVPGLVEL
jgi:hypothetical protein